MINHRDSLFLRAVELLKDFVSFGFDQNERERIRIATLEVLPGMDYEAQQIREDQEA